MLPKLAIIVPCYNEEEIIESTITKLSEKINSLIIKKIISEDSYILLVDDGSIDNTFKIIENLRTENKYIKALKLSHNRGHQIALYAGLENSKDADIVITIDADLQDDIELFENMVKSFLKGNDLVLGVRKERKKDDFLKKFTAVAFYKLMSLMNAKLIFNHADYRLMSRRAVDSLLAYPERNLFLRGLILDIGYSYKILYYNRHQRLAGETKYTIKKMMNLAWDGITSFSSKPIKLILNLGFILLFFSIILFILKILKYTDIDIELFYFSFFTSIQLISLGIIGEYIIKIFIETKRRPRYFIDKKLD